jgi:mRNA interferase MazF
VKRGEIWWAELAKPIGSEPGYRRPVLIVQADSFNKSRISTVIVATLTSNLRLAQAPGNVKLPRRKTGLDRDSVVNVSQLVTLDKHFLSEKAGRLDNATLQQVNEGIRLVLAL